MAGASAPAAFSPEGAAVICYGFPDYVFLMVHTAAALFSAAAVVLLTVVVVRERKDVRRIRH